MRLLRVVGLSLRDAYNELFLVIGLSLLWWLAVVTIVGLAPAMTALATIGYRLAREQRVSLDFAKEAFKEHFWLSWRLGAISLLGVVLIAINLAFYSQTQSWLQVVAFLFLYLAVAWLAINLYAYPLIVAMDAPTARLVLRNAALLTFANPIYSIVLVLIIAVLAVLSMVIPVLAVLALPGVTAIIGARALVDRLELAEAHSTDQDE